MIVQLQRETPTMLRTLTAALAVSLLVNSGAFAQTNDIGSTLASGLEGAVQAFGQAAFAGPSLFITTKGHAKLPAPMADSYLVTVQGRSASAVQAARERDAKIAQLVAIARRSGIAVDRGETSLSLEIDSEAQQAQMREQNAAIQARISTPGAAFTPPPPLPPPPKIFVAKGGLRFRGPATGDLATFFDAVHAAGVDDISRGLAAPLNPFMPRGGEVLGFGSIETLDDGVWNAAGAEALRKARAQGEALAAAGGRALGPVRSIIVLSRGADGDEATEGLGVRFALVDPR